MNLSCLEDYCWAEELGSGDGGFVGAGSSGRMDVVIFVISLGRPFLFVFGFLALLRCHGVVAISILIIIFIIVFVH